MSKRTRQKAIHGGLTAKEARFVQELPNCKWNATRAALIAYDCKNTASAKSIGSALLTHVVVKEAIKRKKAELEATTLLTYENWCEKLLKSAERAGRMGELGNLAKFLDMYGKGRGYYEADNRQKATQVAQVMTSEEWARDHAERGAIEADYEAIDATDVMAAG